MSVLSLIPEERKKCLNDASFQVSNSIKYPCILQKKKVLHPLLLSATKMSASNSQDKKYVAKRILSAKEHKIKQLQNRLADAHYHLTELSNENRLLRNLQKRQDSALQRYENSQGEIPQLITNHSEEIRAWQVRFKQLKSQLKDVNQKLKDKENELQQLSDDHKHLLNLSKNTNLEEREKLQNEVLNLKTKVDKQNEAISSLQRKILLESKSFKQHLNIEISKQKELQQKLLDANKTIERLTATIEMKDRYLISAAMKRNLKRSFDLPNQHRLPNLSNDSTVINNKITPLGSDLSIRGSSVTENMKFNDVSNNSNNSTFTLNKPMMMSELNGKDVSITNNMNIYDQKPILPSIGNHSSVSDTEPPQSSDEDVKMRVKLLKKELKQRNENPSNSSLEKHNNNISSTAESSSSPDDFVDFCNQVEQRRNDIEKFDDKLYIDQLNSKLKEYDMSKITEDLKQIELKAQKQNDEAQMILSDFCDSVVKNAQVSISSESRPSLFSSSSDEEKFKLSNNRSHSSSDREMNNNKPFSIKKQETKPTKPESDLNEDKKKRLLAALDAIDKGEESASSLDILKKINLNKNKISPSSNKSPIFK